MITVEQKRVLDKALQRLQIPEDYALKTVRTGKQNDEDVLVFRYEKQSGENNGTGGEHFSFTINKSNNKILGFIWMDQSLCGGKLPSKEDTKKMAREYLKIVEPELFDKLKNLWIDKHEEKITIKDSTGQCRKITVTGMKYKCYLEEKDDYAWVIVGPGGKINAFEQGIKWNNERITEKWLHDSCITE